MTIEQALTMVKAAGYRVSRPKAQAAPIGLNAVGKPFSPSYDPNYRMKYKPRRYAPGGESVSSYLKPEQWTRMCQEAQAAWDARVQSA